MMNGRNVFDRLFQLILDSKIGEEVEQPNYVAVLSFFEKNRSQLISNMNLGVIALNNLDPEALDAVMNGLKLCLNHVLSSSSSHKSEFVSFYVNIQNEGAHAQATIKLASLAALQIGELQESQRKFENNIASLEKKEKKLKKTLKDYNIQSVTILGIFSAVVFTFSGGFSMVGGAFSGLNDISHRNAFLLMALVMLLSLTLIDVVYLLLSYIERLNVRLVEDECTQKEAWRTIFSTIVKHPLLAFVNVMLVIGILISMLNYSSDYLTYSKNPLYYLPIQTETTTSTPSQLITRAPQTTPYVMPHATEATNSMRPKK